MFLFLLLVALTGVAIGLALSAVGRTSEVAIAMLPIALLPMVILGGIMLPVHKMPGAVRTVAHLMPSRWGFEGLLLLESSGRNPFPAPPEISDNGRPTDSKVETRDWAEESFPVDQHRFSVASSCAALSAMMLSLVVAIYGVLRSRDVRARRPPRRG